MLKRSIAMIMLCAASPAFAAAETPTQLPDFASYQRTAAGAPIMPIRPPEFTLSKMVEDHAFSESVPADAAFQMTSFVAMRAFAPVAKEIAGPAQDIDEVLAANRSNCDLAGGHVTHRMDNRGPIREDPLFKNWFNYLRDSRRTGTHMCLDVQEQLLYELTISPAGRFTTMLVPLGYAWPINIYVLDGAHYRDLERRRSAFEQRIAELRANVEVGAKVQVSTTKLPPKLPDGDRPLASYMCALVTGRQGPLVQVQIHSFLMYVGVDAIYPLEEIDRSSPQSERFFHTNCQH